MRWRRALGGCLRWAATVALGATAAAGAASWRGRIFWVFEPASFAAAARHGVLLLAWPDGSAIDRLVNRVAGLPSLPAGARGTNILDDYRGRLRENLAWQATQEAMQFEPRPLVHAGVPWLWLGGRHNSSVGEIAGLEAPLWIPGALLAPAVGLAWWPTVRVWRRGRAGRCASCGYDRRGLGAGARCPECGGEAREERAAT